MIRVLLADDQTLVRAGFRALLDAQGDISFQLFPQAGGQVLAGDVLAFASDERR